MENLVKQLREKISGLGQRQDEPIILEERRKPLQQTETFKGEKKKSQNWFRRQISSIWNHDTDSGEGSEYEAVAVAATAFAIATLEERLLEQKQLPKGPKEISLAKTESIKKDTAARSPDSSSNPGRLTSKETKKDKQQSTGETKSKNVNQREMEKAATRPKLSDKGSLKSETIKDVLSRPRSYLEMPTVPTAGDRMQKKESTKSIPTAPTGGDGMRKKESTKSMSTVPTAGDGMRMKESTKSNDVETKADAWAKAEMAKIKKWYDKMNSTILSWEHKKRAKANSRKYRREKALEQKRARTLQEYSSEIITINKISRGARALTEERKRKVESKTQEKAKKIRLTGKVPHTCFCF